VGGKRLSCGVIAGGICALALSSPMIAVASDRAVVSTYVRAAASFAQAQAGLTGKSVAAMEAEGANIEHGCRSVLSGAPRDRQSQEIAEEITGAVLFSAAGPDHSAMLRFAHSISDLHWSDPRIARLVRAQADEERTIASLPLPDVCGDVRAWAASGYHTLSAQTTVYVKRIGSIGGGESSKEKSIEAAIAAWLSGHESPGEKRVTKATTVLEEAAGKQILVVFATTLKAVVEALKNG
jgi:hypothetical protein